MSQVSPQVSMSLLLHGWCVTARGGDVQCLWTLVSHSWHWFALKSEKLLWLLSQLHTVLLTQTVSCILGSNKCPSDCQMRRRALKLTLCLITLLSFPNTRSFFSPFLSPSSAYAEMGRWSVCQRKKVISLHYPLSSIAALVRFNNKVLFQAVSLLLKSRALCLQS